MVPVSSLLPPEPGEPLLKNPRSPAWVPGGRGRLWGEWRTEGAMQEGSGSAHLVRIGSTKGPWDVWSLWSFSIIAYVWPSSVFLGDLPIISLNPTGINADLWKQQDKSWALRLSTQRWFGERVGGCSSGSWQGRETDQIPGSLTAGGSRPGSERRPAGF